MRNGYLIKIIKDGVKKARYKLMNSKLQEINNLITKLYNRGLKGTAKQLQQLQYKINKYKVITEWDNVQIEQARYVLKVI